MKKILACLLALLVLSLSACAEREEPLPPDGPKENITAEEPAKEPEKASAPAESVTEPEKAPAPAEPVTEPEKTPAPAEPATEPEKTPAPAEPATEPEKAPAPAPQAFPMGDNCSELSVYSAGNIFYDYNLEGQQAADFIRELDFSRYQKAQPVKELNPQNGGETAFIRLTGPSMEMMYIYQYHPQALFEDENGNRTYYNAPADAFEKAYGAVLKHTGSPAMKETFDKTFRKVTVQKSGEEPVSLDRAATMKLMESIPLPLCPRAEKKKTLSLRDEDAEFILLTNETGRQLAFFKGEQQFKTIAPDGKVAYYDVGENGRFLLWDDSGHGFVTEPITFLYDHLLEMVNTLC